MKAIIEILQVQFYSFVLWTVCSLLRCCSTMVSLKIPEFEIQGGRKARASLAQWLEQYSSKVGGVSSILTGGWDCIFCLLLVSLHLNIPCQRFEAFLGSAGQYNVFTVILEVHCLLTRVALTSVRDIPVWYTFKIWQLCQFLHRT